MRDLFQLQTRSAVARLQTMFFNSFESKI